MVTIRVVSLLLAKLLFLRSIQVGSLILPSPSTTIRIHHRRHSDIPVLHTKLPENNVEHNKVAPSSSSPSRRIPFRNRLSDAAAEGFGTRAKNVASSMSVGDIVVPIIADLERRQTLANRGIYAGVEYEICELMIKTDENNDGNRDAAETITSMKDVSSNDRKRAVAKIKPAYVLRDYLERSDWPVDVAPLHDVPLWLSKTTYEAGTMLGTLALSLSYLSLAAVAAFFVRFTYVPSPSMSPALSPGDVVLVTRILWPSWTKPGVGSVVLFDPPSELGRMVSESAVAQENGASLPGKGERFLKRVVAREGEFVGVKNGNPYVELLPDSGSESSGVGSGLRRFRVDVVGPYSQPSTFPESSWDRSPEVLGRNKYFVSGDNGFRSVDSRVWGPLDGRNIFGEARWVVWPIEDFGPVKGGQISMIEK